jgi:DNA transformation protein
MTASTTIRIIGETGLRIGRPWTGECRRIQECSVEGPKVQAEGIDGTMTEQTFHQRVLDQLAHLGNITSRPTFGGRGVYWEGVIFALLHQDWIYFKVDEQSRGEYRARGIEPFRPNDRQTLKSYYEVPRDVLDDLETLLSWAREAIRAGQSS